MSDSAIAKDCLVHYDNRHIQVRKDFYDICAYDKSQYNIKLDSKGNKVKDEPNQECMAKILRIFETLTNDRKTQWLLEALKMEKQGLTPPSEPEEYPLELSYGAICHLLYYTHGESTVRNCIAVLIERKYITRYQFSKNSIPVYCLQIETLQAVLKNHAEDAMSGVEINSQRKVLKSTAKRLISTPEPLKSTAQGVEINNNNKESKKEIINSKKEEVPAPAPVSLFPEQTDSTQNLTPKETDVLKAETALVQSLALEWKGIFKKKPIVITKTVIEHCRSLAVYLPEPGEITACRLWMYQTDKNKYYTTQRGMTLADVVRKFEEFRSLFNIPEVVPVPLKDTSHPSSPRPQKALTREELKRQAV